MPPPHFAYRIEVQRHDFAAGVKIGQKFDDLGSRIPKLGSNDGTIPDMANDVGGHEIGATDADVTGFGQDHEVQLATFRFGSLWKSVRGFKGGNRPLDVLIHSVAHLDQHLPRLHKPRQCVDVTVGDVRVLDTGARIIPRAPMVSSSIAPTSALLPMLRGRFTQDLSGAITVPSPSMSTPPATRISPAANTGRPVRSAASAAT